MTTLSTQGIYQLLRTRLLGFIPRQGTTLNTRLTGRLYTVQAPDVLVYPYAVMRWMDPAATPEYNDGIRKSGTLEIQVFTRPRSEQWTCEGIADLIEQALNGWADGTSGLTFARHVRRVTMPPAPSPMDREVCQITLFVPVVSWPVMLSQYVTS